jgi:hypothetical protein
VETPENGLTMGENVETGDFGKKTGKHRKTCRSVPRVTAETPENGLTMDENVETVDFWQKGQTSENAPRQVRYRVL